MKTFFGIAATILITCLVPALILAALPPKSEERLNEMAKIILTGKVLDTKATPEGKNDFLNTVYTLTIQIDKFEKGVLMTKSNIIRIRCWNIKKRPDGWAGPSGHYDIPGKGDRCRFWLEKGDNGRWEPLEPNGIAKLEE